jgi:hypothetical protein
MKNYSPAKWILLTVAIALAMAAPSFALDEQDTIVPASQREDSPVSTSDLLASSQISYRAEGGFTGVQSYGVIISCVKGKISVMKSIFDPRLNSEKSRIRQIGTMDSNAYITLWDSLAAHAVLKMDNAPEPKYDILDEFTVTFYTKVGDTLHQFYARGISRPEAAKYFAVRNLIDTAVDMKALWNTHNNLAKHIPTPKEAQDEAKSN